MVFISRWTGSNTNNANNDGNGQARSDRNNIVLLNSPVYPEGNGVQFGPGPKFGQYGLNYPMHLDNGTFLGLSRSDAESLAFNAPGKIKNIYRLCFNSLKINICIIVWLHC